MNDLVCKPEETLIPDYALLPKADQHLHLIISAPLAAYQAISEREIPEPPAAGFGSLGGFLDHLKAFFLPTLSTLENTQFIVREALQHLVADRVVYAEASLPLTSTLRIGVPWKDYAAVIAAERARVADRLTLKLELGHAREIDADWRSLARQALDTGIFDGVDLYGDENYGDIKDFQDFFSLARERNLYIKIHCGECTDAARMRYDIEVARPDAIQHGIAAVTDLELLALLRDRQTPLNVCPTSNVMTGQVARYSEHPIKALVNAGLNVRIASDDFGAFGVSLSEEYTRLLTGGLLSAAQLEKIRLNAL